MKAMIGTRHICLHLLLSLSLVLAPVANAFTAGHGPAHGAPVHQKIAMDHGSMHQDGSHILTGQHCQHKKGPGQDTPCQHNCCSHCFFSIAYFALPNNYIFLTNQAPVFADTLQVAQITFLHYRPPA